MFITEMVTCTHVILLNNPIHLRSICIFFIVKKNCSVHGGHKYR